MARPLRILRNLLIVGLVAGGVTAAVGYAWRMIGGGALPLNGWIALTLGVAGTVGLAWALMALAFRSDRDGWDAQAGVAAPLDDLSDVES